MVTFKNFEEIDAWKEARELVATIYNLSDQEPFSNDYSLKDQIGRASVSTMSNIAEGFERDGKREFIQYLSIAKGSVGEVRSQIYVALDRAYINRNEFDATSEMATNTARMLSGLIGYLKKSNIKGRKYS